MCCFFKKKYYTISCMTRREMPSDGVGRIKFQIDPIPKPVAPAANLGESGQINVPFAVTGLIVAGSMALASCKPVSAETPVPTTSAPAAEITPITPPVTEVGTAIPSATETPVPNFKKPSIFKGLFFGQYKNPDGLLQSAGSVPGYRSLVNTYYREGSDLAAGFSFDNDWLTTDYFHASTDKSGVTRGITPDGKSVIKQGNMWVLENSGGKTLNPYVASLTGKPFGTPVITSDNKFAIVDGTTGAIIDGGEPRDPYQNPVDIAQYYGFTGDPSQVAGVDVNTNGNLVVLGKNGEVLANLAFFAKGELLLEQQPATIKAAGDFAAALTSAGIPTTAEQVLAQGLVTIEKTGADGKKYEVASTQDGYPLMIKMEGGKWEELKPGKFEFVNGMKVYIAGNYDNVVLLNGKSKDEFSGLNTEWAFHLDVSHKEEKTIDYGMMDYALEMSKKAGMDKATGGMLIWDNGNLPAWFKGYTSKETLLPVIEDHISKVVSHYKGKMDTWTVVNEPFKPGNMENSYWHDVFGEDTTWIQRSFVVAHEKDPSAKLILNDYGIEFYGKDKYESIFNLCKELKANGTPINGIGFEMHIYGNDLLTGKQSYEDLRKSIKEFQSLGLEVQFTELDVDMSGFVGSAEDRLNKQAEIYYQIGKIASAEGVTATTIFGEKDDTSWIQSKNANPTLFDKDFNKKLAYFAFLRGMIDGLKD